MLFYTCGTCLRPSDKVRKLNSDRYDVLSIPLLRHYTGTVPGGDATGTRKGENLPSSPCVF